MEKVGIRELRQYASRYIDRVKSGESFEVTERGVPVAMLSPAQKPSLYDRLVAEGTLEPAQGDLSEWLRQNPPPPPPSETSISDALQDQREERR